MSVVDDARLLKEATELLYYALTSTRTYPQTDQDRREYDEFPNRVSLALAIWQTGMQNREN